MAEKEHLNLVFIGHVDSGKSTSVGRILYETGAITEQQLKKLKDEAQKLGKATFEFAFVMDQLKEERARGVTIDIAHKEFTTDKYYFTIIDAPGHRDFVKNMITGTSQADAAVLVISVKDGVQPQTKEHAFLAKVLGIGQLIVNLNKMDAVGYKQEEFIRVKADVEKLLKGIGYKVEDVPFVPCSSYAGDNVTKKTTNMSWYNGPTLLDLLNKLTVPPKLNDLALRMPVQEVFSITGHGTVPVGRIETGVLKPGMQVVFMPSGRKAEVKKVEMHHQELKEGKCGDNVGFNVKGVDRKDVKRGDVIGPVDNPPTVAQDFTAQIVVLNHPTAISVGYTPVFHVHTAQFAGKVIEIIEKKDPKSGQPTKENLDFIKTGESAVVKIQPMKPVCIEKFQDFRPLGRFAIRDMGQTVAAGVVLKVTPKQVEIK
ncbi:MAG TPA: translation elongation factor EF-1 subunit alpha [Candidatus Bilamarchaeaceae archaeon]|nr:translation elongation factor EF-1 subunit alpha [Candidatus Bilamarchaeaceae archaeon]